MFEKSLYDLIKGLRNHKGTEEDYIQSSLRECKTEIKSQDTDKKATALLKIIYLEMFGYDMSWASFHVLEVMSSSKYLQKRVGYLGAVQSFRPDTEVLMLATNLLKKDISSASLQNMCLPMITLPHIITPSLSMSLLPDILSRLSHSNAMVRKKAIVCLYRLALVYPEALKLAWPKMKVRLMDDQEDISVTTAVINVVCELGWRRPHDILPLAPRLFDLLVDGGNNWMAIKIIKLFATLTPLEPRLVRKLLRPLTSLIQTTTAMSLLYECVNGIVQGGIFDSDENFREKDEIANLCVGKLRGMIVTDADPNLKYVALLAFNRIVASHPVSVSMQQDVILDCLEDADISIRLQALELVTGMVTSDTLQFVVNRLAEQLNKAFSSPPENISNGDQELTRNTAKITAQRDAEKSALWLPPEYRIEVSHRIVDMCSCNTYSELPDFEWYIDVLVQLMKHILSEEMSGPLFSVANIASRLGSEIRNIAVRVPNVRFEATRAAEFLLVDNGPSHLRKTTSSDSILGSLAWVVGEYAEDLSCPEKMVETLIDVSNMLLPARTLSIYLQAIPKILIYVTTHGHPWDGSRRSECSLVLARVTAFLEAVSCHPDLDVQERAVEFLEVLRLATETLNTEPHSAHEMPFILATVIPGLFAGLELNPVAAGAQRKVPLPETLTLGRSFNNSLWELLDNPSGFVDLDARSFSQDFYYARNVSTLNGSHTEFAPTDMGIGTSYQSLTIGSLNENSTKAKHRKERNRDDPFYIDTEGNFPPISTPVHGVLNPPSRDGLDVESIPIIDLDINNEEAYSGTSPISHRGQKRPSSLPKKYDIVVDENIDCEGSVDILNPDKPSNDERSLLRVDTSGFGHLSLEEHTPGPSFAHDHAQGVDDAEMVNAMQEVERVRLEMQRASERVYPRGVPADGTLVKKKKKVRKPNSNIPQNTASTGPVVRKKAHKSKGEGQ